MRYACNFSPCISKELFFILFYIFLYTRVASNTQPLVKNYLQVLSQISSVQLRQGIQVRGWLPMRWDRVTSYNLCYATFRREWVSCFTFVLCLDFLNIFYFFFILLLFPECFFFKFYSSFFLKQLRCTVYSCF